MANQWLTGSGVPSLGTGTTTDYYRDTANNLVYYRENPTTWVVVPAFTPNPDGIGTTWLHGATAPLTAQGSDGDYFYEDTHKIVYRKDGSNWVPKGSLDFIGIYGVQWGNGLGAPASTVPLNNLPAGSFYLDVQTSNIYFKNPIMVWELKGQLGDGGGSSVTVEDVLNSTSTVNALSANQGKVLSDALAGKLNTSAYNDHYKGTYVSLVSLQAAHTTAALGDYALVDAGTGDNAHIYIWDAQEGWVQGSQTSLLNTDSLTEGSVKLYFTEGRVRSTLLTGIALATNAVISATDSVLSAFGKLQKQITDLPNIFPRYDQAQTLSDAAKSQALTNIGAKKSYNMLPTKTAAYAPTLADFKDAVDLYDKVYLRMNLTTANNVTVDTTLSSLPNLTEITIRDLGTARVTLVEDGTVLNGIKTFSVQNEVKTLVKVGANEWDIVGALT